jgi:hypothetical protein
VSLVGSDDEPPTKRARWEIPMCDDLSLGEVLDVPSLVSNLTEF